MQEVPFEAEMALWQAFVGAFWYWGARSVYGELLSEAANEMQRIRPDMVRSIMPKPAPIVDRLLEGDVGGSGHKPLDELVEQIIATKDLLEWRILDSSYAGEQMSSDYAFTILVGPDYEHESKALFHSEKVMAGITLQGPQVFYASHWHPAVEFYGVLSGNDGEWQLGEAAFEVQPAGTLIHHASMMPHAMRTNRDPMLTVFAWTGDLYTFPVVG